jgi:hypothetical protein
VLEAELSFLDANWLFHSSIRSFLFGKLIILILRAGLYYFDLTYKALPNFKAPLLIVENGHAQKLIPPRNFILIL